MRLEGSEGIGGGSEGDLGGREGIWECLNEIGGSEGIGGGSMILGESERDLGA